MTDLPLEWIGQQLNHHNANDNELGLWCTDENALNSFPAAAVQKRLLIISNRWDVAEQAKAQGFNAEFSDFDCRQIDDASVTHFFYRVSKEKPVVHHLLNEAWRCLKPDGKLLLAGYKNEGIKTYIEKIATLLGCDKTSQKNGPIYCAQLIKKNTYNAAQRLDDSDYTSLRPLPVDNALQIVSKPGLFGWNKIDAGSALLIEQLQSLANPVKPFTSCLDLGCGYGFLTIAAAQLAIAQTIDHWILIDNNAAALIAAQQNLNQHRLRGEVIAADAGKGINTQVDLLLCNPPFHQGFALDGDLTDKFLRRAHSLLKKQGTAIFVVNQFIPLERKAAALFKSVSLLIDNGSFKVIQLREPR